VRYPQCKTVVFRPSDQCDAPTASDCTSRAEPAAELQLVHAYGLPRAAAPRGAHGASPIVLNPLQGDVVGGIVTSTGVTGATAAAAVDSKSITVVYATAVLAVVHEVSSNIKMCL
jgi:hypothetical protein